MTYRAKTAYEWIVRCYEWDADQDITAEKAQKIAEYLFDHAGLNVTAGYVYDTWKQLQKL